MQQKVNENVVVMDTGVNQETDSARILLMMDMHGSLKDISIGATDEYLDKSIKFGWDKTGNRIISTNVGICDTKMTDGKEALMYCMSALDLAALEEFLSIDIKARNSMNPAMLTRKVTLGAEKRFRKFLKLEKEANAKANEESVTRDLNEFLRNLDSVKGLFFFMSHNEHIVNHKPDEIYFISIYNNCNKFNTATFVLSNSIKSEIMEKATNTGLAN